VDTEATEELEDPVELVELEVPRMVTLEVLEQPSKC
jgi:hypothetical protein